MVLVRNHALVNARMNISESSEIAAVGATHHIRVLILDPRRRAAASFPSAPALTKLLIYRGSSVSFWEVTRYYRLWDMKQIQYPNLHRKKKENRSLRNQGRFPSHDVHCVHKAG